MYRDLHCPVGPHSVVAGEICFVGCGFGPVFAVTQQNVLLPILIEHFMS